MFEHKICPICKNKLSNKLDKFYSCDKLVDGYNEYSADLTPNGSQYIVFKSKKYFFHKNLLLETCSIVKYGKRNVWDNQIKIIISDLIIDSNTDISQIINKIDTILLFS